MIIILSIKLIYSKIKFISHHVLIIFNKINKIVIQKLIKLYWIINQTLIKILIWKTENKYTKFYK
jgi:hypothetical protein